MTPEQLIANYPVLHHMAEAGSWTAIQQIGLRTTEQLVDACAPDAELRAEILDGKRKESYTLTHPVVGSVTIRDQQPLKMHNLLPKLSGVTLEQFLKSLNDRVFLWAHPQRLEKLLGAKLYRDSLHDVLVIDAAKLVERHSENIRLSRMNTGSTIFPNTPPRTPDTFQTIADFPFDVRKAARKPVVDNLVEVCVLGGVDDIVDCVTRVESRRGATTANTVYGS